MITIPLSNGFVTVVSPEDGDLARVHRWFGNRVAGGKIYAMRSTRAGGRKSPVKTFYLHRIVAGARPGQIVDHINGDGLDNRRENLRLADATQNCANRRGYRPASGYRGVYKVGRRWRSEITARGQVIRAKFDCPIAAARNYDQLARRHFGEFAVLNFPEDR